MEAATVPAAAVQKKCYRNNTAGHIGVVKLDHRGEPQGENVEPFGTVWLSDDEVILTARAPRRPEDNPFEEQSFWRQDPDTDQRHEVKVRPLTLASDEQRAMPTNDRYVPIEGAAQAPTQTSAADPPPVASAPRSTGSMAGADQAAPPVPAMATPAAPAPRVSLDDPPVGRSELAAEQESWTAPPEAPGRVLPGKLSGSNEPPPDPAASPDATDHPGQATPGPVAGQAHGVLQTPGQEEHAQQVDPAVGEETGAARPPAQDQPEGEYARAEEVGSPDAPAAHESTQIEE